MLHVGANARFAYQAQSAEKFVDDTELYDEELEEALKYATGAA